MSERFTVLDLKRSKKELAIAVVAQMKLKRSDFTVVDGLLYPRNVRHIKRKVEALLINILPYKPDLVVFPELCIPTGVLPLLEVYSKENKTIIVAGTHYADVDGKRISVCPIFIDGERHDIHKLRPSPFERSMFESDGLQPGQKNTVFINTPVGNFVTLICADFLDDEILTYVTSDFNLDFLIIPSCQKDSNRYFTRLSEKVKDSKEGLYGLFPNLFIPSESEGRSGIMGSVDNIYINSAITKKITDARPETKLWEASSDNDFVIAEFNLKQKKPFKVKSHEAEPNVKILRTRAHIPKTRPDYNSARNKYKIVGFDMDGTLIRNLKFSWVKLWELAGDTQGKLWKAYLRDYRTNKIDYATWCKEAVAYYRDNGIKKSDIVEIANQCSLTENFQSGIKKLKDAGFVVGIISGGIDTFHHTLIPNHKEIFDFEYINKLLFSTDDELLSVESTEYDFDYKFDAMELECDERGFSISEAIFVGDQFNDDAILKKVGHSIVYSSNDDPVGLTSHHAIYENDFNKLVDYILSLNE